MYYMTSAFYAPSAAHGARFDDPAFKIQWPSLRPLWFPSKIATGR
jgi:dTDP-4-dehydrorhamnose 3,5-epimerase-like enzyme